MGIYRNAGYLMIILGVVEIISGISSFLLTSITGNLGLGQYQNLENMQQTLKQNLLINVVTSAVYLVFLAVLFYYIYNIGKENEISSIWIGLLLSIIGVFVATVIIMMVLPQMIDLLASMDPNNPDPSLFGQIFRLTGIMLLASFIPLVGYILLGIGLRSLGSLYDESKLQTGGLLVILGFIPLLLPIGFIISGIGMLNLDVE